ncbi:uncharacterized protein O3C94_020129 [Discoglossus pictus]
MNCGWRKYLPEAVAPRDVEAQPSPVVEDIVSLGKFMGLQVSTEDIKKLVGQRIQEELQEHQREQQHIVGREEAPTDLIKEIPLGDLVALSIRVDIEITVGIELDLASPKLVFDKCENIVTGIYMKGFGVLDMAEGMLHSMAPPVLCLPVETALCLLDAAVSLFGGLLPLDMLGGLLPGGEAAAEEGYDQLNPNYDIMQILGSDFNPDDTGSAELLGK